MEHTGILSPGVGIIPQSSPTWSGVHFPSLLELYTPCNGHLQYKIPQGETGIEQQEEPRCLSESEQPTSTSH